MMNVKVLDLNFQDIPHAIASYLVEGADGPFLIETGPGSTLNTLMAQLAEHNYTPEDIRHVLVTHIHLDHAGAAGWWAQQGATVYVHHFGARHLIDPSKLLASAERIYGDNMDKLWGDVAPAPAENVVVLHDGDKINVCGVDITALETPGHARHHHVLAAGRIAFAGDAVGIRLPNQTFIDLPAPPPEFDLEVWLETLDRLRAEQFAVLYPTHFGPVEDVAQHLDRFETLLQEGAQFVRERMEAGVERDELVEQYEEWDRQRAEADGVEFETFFRYATANPLYMTVDGIMRYWRKRLGGQ